MRVAPEYMPSVKLVAFLERGEEIVASAAKATLSPREFESIALSMSQENLEKWLSELIARGHGSPLEHTLYIFEVICSRVCSHQLVRHRHASYSQLSQRFSDKYLGEFIDQVVSELSSKQPVEFSEKRELLEAYLQRASQTSFEELLGIVGKAFIVPLSIIKRRDREFLLMLIRSVIDYYRLLGSGVPYEDARYTLPQSIKTRIIVSMNARELVEVFLPLRMCSRAQWEIRTIAWLMWRELISAHPRIFKYAGPRCVLFENRARREICSLEDYLSGKCEFTIERCPEKIPRNCIHACLLNGFREADLTVGGTA